MDNTTKEEQSDEHHHCLESQHGIYQFGLKHRRMTLKITLELSDDGNVDDNCQNNAQQVAVSSFPPGLKRILQ